MRVIIVGSGPAGLTLGAGLARRGHEVVAFDRDPGPAADGTWRRKGVMQFEHAHGFRPQVRDLLLAEWPAAYEEWVARGAEPVAVELPVGVELAGVEQPVAGGLPGVPVGPVGVRSRRSTYERALRAAAARVRGLTLRHGHVQRLAERDGRVTGVVADGTHHGADLVVVASGRASALAGAGSAELAGDCGIAYVHRSYRLRDADDPGPMSSPFAWSGVFDGYQALVFRHERGHFSVVVVRPCADVALRRLRHRGPFDAACRAIPGLAAWTDPTRAVPVGDVLVGGRLRNTYHRPRPVPGTVAVGDAVSTTTPTAGRGLAMCSSQIAALLALLDGGADPIAVAVPFAAWCDEQIRPWVEDHVARDTEALHRWQRGDLDLSAPLTSSAILDAAVADARILDHAAAFMTMNGLPSTLAPAEPMARAVYESGWRPPYTEGPSRDELVAVIDEVARRASERRPGPVVGRRGRDGSVVSQR